MQQYVVTAREVWIQDIMVMAESEEEAIYAATSGEGDYCLNGEYSHDFEPETWIAQQL